MKTHIQNPFQFGTIVSGEHFCNRQKELSDLTTYIRDGYSVWLYSPRRYGKSSLIQKAFSEVKGVHTVYFDLYNVRSLDDFSKKYANLIAKNLFSWKQEINKLTHRLSHYFNNLSPVVSFDHTGSPSFTLNVGEIKRQADVETILNIPQQVSHEINQPICIAFDEFQEIERIDPFVINWMRSAFQHHKNVSYIFSGSEQSLMEMLFASRKSPFYEFAVKMHIDPIDKEELAQFIAEKFSQQGLTISRANIDSILERSEGHPHFTQYYASVVFDMIRGGEDQDADNFKDRWIDKIIQSQSVILQDIYAQLTNKQRSALSAIALLQEHEELFSNAVREKYRLPASSTLATALDSLIKKGLIIKHGNRYKMLNPVFRAWLEKID